jgi:hypothetical protein
MVMLEHDIAPLQGFMQRLHVCLEASRGYYTLVGSAGQEHSGNDAEAVLITNERVIRTGGMGCSMFKVCELHSIAASYNKGRGIGKSLRT